MIKFLCLSMNLTSLSLGLSTGDTVCTVAGLLGVLVCVAWFVVSIVANVREIK